MDIFTTGTTIISQYTRQEAIADGTLIDLMQPESIGMVRRAGFKYPVAMTHAAYCNAIDHRPDNSVSGEVIDARILALLNSLREAIRSTGRGDCICFDVADPLVPASTITLKCVCGPDDEGSPALTIMMSDED